jgi:hypothetical protein
MNRRLIITLAICYWLSVLIILGLTYPLTDYREGIMTAEETVIAYVEMTSLIWALGMLVWWLVSLVLGLRPVLAGGVAFLMSAGTLCAYGTLVLRAPIEIRFWVTRGPMGAHFFREYMPVVFSWMSGPLCALALAVVVILHGKSRVARTARFAE